MSFKQLYDFCMINNVTMTIRIAELWKCEIQLQQGNWKISYRYDSMEELDNHAEYLLGEMINRLNYDSHKTI